MPFRAAGEPTDTGEPAARSFPSYTYRYASATTRADAPSWLVLLAKGWTIEHVDERYWSVVMRKEDERGKIDAADARQR